MAEHRKSVTISRTASAAGFGTTEKMREELEINLSNKLSELGGLTKV